MGLTAADAIDQVHYLLGQSATASASVYVTDDQISAWLDEGIRLMCYRGKVLPKVTSSGSLSASPLTISTVTGSFDLVDMVGVINSSGVALNKISPKDAGKYYLSGTANDTMWWYVFGDNLYLIPTPSVATFSLQYFACPTTAFGKTTNDMDETYGFDAQHWNRPVSFAAFRGLMTYNRVNDAMQQLQAFSSGIIMDFQLFAAEYGVRI